ncbi:MAG: hypothetical protein Q4F13_03915 [Pseudomonadota bacterium]|nr:hypothetical protein [Pseudomonadota bacterium]
MAFAHVWQSLSAMSFDDRTSLLPCCGGKGACGYAVNFLWRQAIICMVWIHPYDSEIEVYGNRLEVT